VKAWVALGKTISHSNSKKYVAYNFKCTDLQHKTGMAATGMVAAFEQ